MGYKIQGALKKVKKYLIIYAILWLFFVIVFVMPFSAGYTDASAEAEFSLGNLIGKTGDYFRAPFSSFGQMFKPNYWSDFVGIVVKFSVVFLIIEIVGIVRNAPKNEYENIEHGSSDWSQRGEQYKVLSNKKGIILGENNYLPVDKRGNVNVLVVGRIWIW